MEFSLSSNPRSSPAASLSPRIAEHGRRIAFSRLSSPSTRILDFSEFGRISTRKHYLGAEKPLTHPVLQKLERKVQCYRKTNAVVEGRSVAELYDRLAERLFYAAVEMKDPGAKYLVGLAGPPGAGKTTLASEVVSRVNDLWTKNFPRMDSLVQLYSIATVLPMDGFHLYRSQLDEMEDPKEAHARRGAPWTFNSTLFLKCLQTLRKEGSVYAPSFDHGVGDPVENDIFVSPQHKVIIVEGNYLLLQDGAWKEMDFLFDEKWFIDIDLEIAMERVLKRHISTGKARDVAEWRIQYNDRPNAELIMKSKENADVVIKSVDI